MVLFYSEQMNSGEPPNKLPHYEQLDSLSNMKKISNSRNRPLSKVSIENTTPTTPLMSTVSGVDTSGIKKRYHSSVETSNTTLLTRKRRAIPKLNQEIVSNENIKQEPISNRVNGLSSEIIIEQIDDELLKRLSQGKKKNFKNK